MPSASTTCWAMLGNGPRTVIIHATMARRPTVGHGLRATVTVACSAAVRGLASRGTRARHSGSTARPETAAPMGASGSPERFSSRVLAAVPLEEPRGALDALESVDSRMKAKVRDAMRAFPNLRTYEFLKALLISLTGSRPIWPVILGDHPSCPCMTNSCYCYNLPQQLPTRR
jgi:hypothetical protein